MGSLQTFRCDACGYEAEIGGGFDYGMLSATWTVHCLSCRTLSDVLVSEDPSEFSRDGWKPERYSCEKEPGHEVVLWSNPGPCPRCGKTLIPGETTMLWD